MGCLGDLRQLILLLVPLSSGVLGKHSHQYTNSWAVHIPNADHEKANKLADRHGMVNLGQVGSLKGIYHFRHLSHPRRLRREIVERTSRLSRETEVKWVEQQVIKRRIKRDDLATFNDPLWRKQWYLHNNDNVFNKYDHNVIPVWKELNITGHGISVSILDDGIEKDHPDLKANYDPEASYDYNNNDNNPSPRPTYNDENRHGTRCAGEVAAMADNNFCGVGVAYGAKIGGIRMLDGDVTDVVEAQSLSYNPLHIDIYSSSWGPDDDGKTVDGPGPLAKRAFKDGIAKGRGGLGNIFVWASGNGGRDDDNCNCDGYTNSIFTLSISSATEHGTSPWYSEYCASTLASTFSSGSFRMRKVVTTDLHHKCTESHTGTSASAPLAAGILALALEANPKLTWRDMQHIVVRTSTSARLKSTDWITNGVGRKVSHRFGYGLLDAEALVKTAMKWKTVPEKHDCFEAADTNMRKIPGIGTLTVEKETTGCAGTSNYIRYLEHIEVVISLKFTRRGDLTIYVTSPQGTRSTLLGKRRMDYNKRDGFNNWVFMSTHTWEENPKGKWKIEIANVGSSSNSGTLTRLQFRFHGTGSNPSTSYENCDSECEGGCSGPKASDCVSCAHHKCNGVCVNECPVNDYADAATNECLPCHNECFQCSGPGADECNACHPPRFLYGGKCVKGCPERWFPNTDQKCEKCDAHCLSCSGAASDCTACEDDYQLVYNKCVIHCKKTEYIENAHCRACHPSCATCSNSTAWSCTGCGTTTATRGARQDLYLHRGMCVVTCPSGFYGDSYQCLPCHSSCKHCTGALATQCVSCKDGLVKVTNGSGLCLDECPAGYSHRISENACVKCRLYCTACDPDEPTTCTACDRDLFLWKQNCVKPDACPGNTYPEPSTNKCEYCHPSCKTCVDPPTTCTSCAGYLYLHSNKCIPRCPTGTYRQDNKCLPCSSNCSSCFKDGQCLECANGFYLFTNKCVEKCPEGMFVKNTTGRCEHCSITCESCVGKAEDCFKCKDGLKKINGRCVSLCEHGSYLNGTTRFSNHSLAQSVNSSELVNSSVNKSVNKSINKSENMSENKSVHHCSKCQPSCLTCNAGRKFDCLRCKGVKFLDPTNKLCSFNCPASGFYEDIESTLCKRCPWECDECSNKTTCTKCKAGLVLHSTKCVPHCLEGFFANKKNTCAKCSSTCNDCSGSASLCIKCNVYQILFNGECINQCPTGMFLSKAFNRCLACDDSCLTCVGPGRTRCTSCNSSKVLFQAQCRSSCPIRYYFNPDTKQCQPCDYYCHSCNGGNGPSNCTECVAPFVLENHMCVRTCSPGLVLEQDKRRCVPCHSSCTTCLGPTSHDCQSCHDSKASLEHSVCKDSCDVGKYRDPMTSYCERCHPTCKSCSGGGDLGCIDCVNGLQYSPVKKVCLSQCPEGQYHNNGDCYTCSSSCKTCKGGSGHECLSCEPNHRLYNFTCVKHCPPSTHPEDSNGLMECRTCYPSCATCTGKASDHCTSCRQDLYLEKHSCVKQCSLTFRLDEDTRTCKRCNNNCPSFANLSDRSVYVPKNNENEPSSGKHKTHFVLIIMATATTLLVVFALIGTVRSNSSRGYTRVKINSTGNVEEQPGFPNNNVHADVYIRDENLEREELLEQDDNEI